MARNKHSRHGKPGFTLSVAVLAGLAPAAADVWSNRGSLRGMGNTALYDFTGYDATHHVWNAEGLKTGLLPLGLGVLVHKFVGQKLGINRMIARSGIPVIRL